MKKQNIEDIFSSMEDFSSVPPPELWSQIEEKLDKPKKKKRAILWWSAAACLLLGLMLPSVLHFNSGFGLKNSINGSGTTPNHNVVIENEKGDLNTKTNTTEKTAPEKDNFEKEDHLTKNSIVTTDEESSQKAKSISTNSFQNKETAVAHADAKKAAKNNNRNSKLNGEKTTPNQAVAQQQNYVSGKANSFNSMSKYSISKTEKTATDKILAEKTFNAGKSNRFNSNLKNQVSTSIFENKVNPNNNKNNNVAFTAPFPTLNGNQNAFNTNKSFDKNQVVKPEKGLADNQSGNSKFKEPESKLDSVQLAQLQNLEKGIKEPETKKEKDTKPTSHAEKWAVEVFAGVASSENYKNEKTLGYTNEAKQSNAYGVKTKYKINKRWAVGSGFKINELGQSIANVSYISSNAEAFLTPSGSYIANDAINVPQQISKNSNYIFVSNNTTSALKNSNIQSDNLQTGNLDQNLRYLEMPFEVSYAVFSKNKASISLNTGGFMGKLISNNIALNGNSIGENTNANDFVYGSTLSSTLQYRIYKKTNIFAEPAVNYYINPLNNQSFNQFQWGLNFGLNVSF